MQVKVKFFTLLRLELGISELNIQIPDKDKIRLKDLLYELEKRTPKPFLRKLLDEKGLKQGVIILKNGKNVLELQGLDTWIEDQDELSLFPPGGGG